MSVSGIVTNEGSAFDLLPPGEKKASMHRVKLRLGPRCDESLLRWSLRAANNNIGNAVNLYLRYCCGSDPIKGKAQVASVLRKLFRLEPQGGVEALENSDDSIDTVADSKHGHSSSRINLNQYLKMLPDALLRHIASYSNIFTIGRMTCSSTDLARALNKSSPFWRQYYSEQFPHTGCFGILAPDPDTENCGISSDAEAEEPQDAALCWRRVLRSKLCEHFGCCPRCYKDALLSDSMSEFLRSITQAKQNLALVPVVFGFPSPVLVDLAKEKLLYLGEDHIISGDSPVWACNECGARYTMWPFLHPLVVDEQHKMPEITASQ